MKKIYLYLLLCLLASQLKAQQGVVFKVKYQPGRTYQSTNNISIKPIVNLTGNAQLMNQLSSQGITQPINGDISLSFNGVITTGAATADNTFPVNFDYQLNNVTLKANGKDLPIPQNKKKNIKIYGHMGTDGQLKIDSADGKKTNDTVEKKMQQLMNMVQRQIKFPDKPLKPGDTFTQGMPVNIPINQMGDVKIDVNVTYKLINITGDNANFDIVENINFNIQLKKGTVSVTGTGGGKMVYSIKNNFPVALNSLINMKLNAAIDGTTVNGTAIVNNSHTTVIN